MSHSGSQDGYESAPHELATGRALGPEFRPAKEKKRSSVACLSCRSRKIRCDVSQRGPPCLNCTLDKETCLVKRRPKTYRISKVASSRPSARYVEDSLTPTSPRLCADDAPNFEQMLDKTAKQAGFSVEQPRSRCDRTGNHGAQEENLALTNWTGNSGHISGEACRNHIEYVERNPDVGTVTSAKPWKLNIEFSGLPSDSRSQGHLKHPAVDNFAPQIISESANISMRDVIFSYYPFLEMDTMSQMSSDAVNFLELQQCFRIPTPEILDDFVREYFLHVHPNAPIIDEGAFWDLFRPSSSAPSKRPRISLFVFRAMLFASCCFVSLETIQKLGFPDIRSARIGYYKAAKALFQFDEARDSISTAQGVLLLTYYTSQNGKENSYWLGLAIHFARDAGAHQYDIRRQASKKQRNILKRLWWCCILRDRVISLGLRRPLQISSEEFDFSVPGFIAEDFEDEIGLSQVYDQVTKRALVRIIVSLSELSVVLTEVIMMTCPRKEISNLPSRATLDGSYRLIEKCKSSLGCWYERTRVHFTRVVGIDSAHKSLKLYTNLTYIYYFSANVVLHNYAILISAAHSSNAVDHWDRRYKSKDHLQEGLIGVTENLKELIQLKLSKYLPISVVAYAVLPLLMHVLDVQLSTTVSQRAIRQPRLDMYTRAMEAFQAQYDGTDKALDIVRQLVDNMSFDSRARGSQKEINVNKRSTQEHRLLSDMAISPPGDARSLVVYDWGDILLRQPTCYVRLALAIDFSLCNGRMPQNSEFPDHLQFRDQGALFPMFRIITTQIEATAHELPDSPITSLDQSRRLEIDDENRPENDDSADSRSSILLETSNGDSVQTPLSTSLQEFRSPALSEHPLDYTAFDILMLESEIRASNDSSFWSDEMLLMDFHSG